MQAALYRGVPPSDEQQDETVDDVNAGEDPVEQLRESRTSSDPACGADPYSQIVGIHATNWNILSDKVRYYTHKLRTIGTQKSKPKVNTHV